MRELIERLERRADEAAYPGNLGAVEMLQFYRVASSSQIKEMEGLLARGKYSQAWKLLQKVTGVKLFGRSSKFKTRAA